MLRPDRPAGRVAGPPAALAANARGRGAGDCVGTADWADRQPVARLGRVGLQRHARQPLGAGVPTVCGRVVFSQRAGRMAGKRDAPAGGVAHNHATQITSLANLRPSQSNKMDKETKMQDAPQSWSELWALEPGVYSWVQQIPFDWQPEDTPSGGLLRVELIVRSSGDTGGSHSFVLSYLDGTSYLKRYFGEQTGDGNGRIATIATATPPQEYALPLADGYVAGASGAFYSKTQDGIVTITISDVQRADGLGLASGIISTIPVGFRPHRLISVACNFTAAEYNTNISSGILQALPNGEVWIGVIDQSAHAIHGQICYIAGN